MNSKEKAKELLTKYSCYFHGIDENVNYAVVLHNDAKQCALIAVDEIIGIKLLWYQKDIAELYYWQEVKREIQKV